jgi:HD superfamily phosphodiesterase
MGNRFTSMNYEGAKEKVLELLMNGLSDKLHYHGLHHTLDVLQITTELCELEGIDEYHTLLLQTAALYHDSGFTQGNKDHESLGCDICRRILPDYGYTPNEIEVISGMIMSTKIPQSPKNRYEEIICDADLDYLGRDDFYEIGKSLFHELAAYNILSDEKVWNRIQVAFIGKHSYFTATNNRRREHRKQAYLEELKCLVATYELE